jgi:hypothetical protein
MSTIIRPESGEDWDEVFPDAYEAPELISPEEEADQAFSRLGRRAKWQVINTILYLLAALFSRGEVKIKVAERARVWALNLIISAWVHDFYDKGVEDSYADDREMADFGRHVLMLVKVLDTNPRTHREYKEHDPIVMPEAPSDGERIH